MIRLRPRRRIPRCGSGVIVFVRRRYSALASADLMPRIFHVSAFVHCGCIANHRNSASAFPCGPGIADVGHRHEVRIGVLSAPRLDSCIRLSGKIHFHAGSITSTHSTDIDKTIHAAPCSTCHAERRITETSVPECFDRCQRTFLER